MSVRRAIVSGLFLRAIVCAQDVVPQPAVSNVVRLNNEAVALTEEGRFLDAEKLYRTALADKSSDDLARAKISNNLAYLYRRQDRYRDAEQALRRSLEWRQKNLPPESVDVAYALNNLADVYRIEGRDWEARNLLETAVKNLREFHPDASGFTVVAGNLAVVLCKFNEFNQAEALLQSALAHSEREHGTASREVGIVLNNLAKSRGRRRMLNGPLPCTAARLGSLKRWVRRVRPT